MQFGDDGEYEIKPQDIASIKKNISYSSVLKERGNITAITAHEHPIPAADAYQIDCTDSAMYTDESLGLLARVNKKFICIWQNMTMNEQGYYMAMLSDRKNGTVYAKGVVKTPFLSGKASAEEFLKSSSFSASVFLTNMKKLYQNYLDTKE